nr:hypothetical protein [Tanacetum cinerariifolium]
MYEDVKVVYEWKPPVCNDCGVFRHVDSSCYKKEANKAASSVDSKDNPKEQTEEPLTHVSKEVNDGFAKGCGKKKVNEEEEDVMKEMNGIDKIIKGNDVKGLSSSEKQKEVVNFIREEKLHVCVVLETHLKNKRIVLNSSTRLFSFQFSSMDGLNAMLENAFSEDGLSAIATGIGSSLMLDSYTSDMYLQSWGRLSYTRAMIKLRADEELKNTIVVAMLKITGEGYYMCAVHVEYEWKPPRSILMDENGNPLKKVEYLGDHDSEYEVASVDNDMARTMTLEKVGFGTQSLLGKWRDSYGNSDYDDDPYDDDMYEGQDLPEELQTICDNMDIRVRGRGRGLRQGDPVSPYIFTIVMEILTLLIKRKVEQNANFQYHFGCKRLKITNVCFADDLLMFCHADKIYVSILKDDIDEFGRVVDLIPNYNKITIIFDCLNEEDKKEMLEVMPFKVKKLPIRYLDVPLTSKRIKIKECKSLIDKKGGLGLKDLGIWNKATIIKHLWHIVTNKESLWVKWINTEKLKGRSFKEIEEDKNDSQRDDVRKFIVSKLRDGSNTSVCVYLIWEERNNKIFRDEERSNDELFKVLNEMVRIRLMSLKAKDTEIHGAGVSHEDANQKFLRSLPSSWSQVALIMRTKPGLDTLSFDDLYNNLRVFKRNIKGTTASSSNTQNVAFVSADNTSSTNDDILLETVELKGTKPAEKEMQGTMETKLETMVEDLHIRMTQTLWLPMIERILTGSDNEVKSCSKACEESYARLKKLYDEQRDKLGDASVEITAYTLALKRYGSILSYENEVLQSVFMNKASDLEDTPVNDRYAEGMQAVPPPMTGNYMPSGLDVEIDYSKFTYGLKQTSAEKSDSKPSEYASCKSDSSVETSTSMPEPVENASKVVCKTKVWTDDPIIEEYESDSDNDLDDPHRALKDKRIIDSGCSRYMTGNKAHLADYQEFKGGSVAFGGSNGRILGNLVRGLPSKIFENDHTCVACQKEKQHKASYSFLPTTFWVEAVNTACYVLNRVLVTKPQNKTPYELLTGKQPIISYLRPFGCHVTILNIIDQLGKFDGKSNSGFLVGYSLNSKAFRVYNLETKRVEENLHVNFLENKPSVAEKGHAWMFDLDYLTNSMNYEPVSVENQANKSAGPKEANNCAGTANDDQGVSSEEIDLHEEHFVLPIRSAYSTIVKSSGDKIEKNAAFQTSESLRKEATHDIQNANTSSTNLLNIVSTPLSTTGSSRAFNNGELSYPDDTSMPHLKDIYTNPSERIFTDSSYDDEGVVTDFNNLEITVSVSPTPTTRIHIIHPKTQILGDPMSVVQTRSKVNKNSKAHALVWILVDLPFRKKAIRTKWVYKNKKDKKGVVVRNKARLVAQGHRQKEGIDYDEVFSLVARIKAIQIFLAFSSYMDFIVYQMDVKSAFLYGTIDEEVYLSQPPGFVDPKFPNKVYKVMKALYGLHQAPRAWYATLSTFLENSRYRRGAIDKTLFIKQDKKDIMLVKQKEECIFISQDKYVAKILKKFDFLSVKTVSTSIETQKHLVKDKEAADVDVHLYRTMIGSLMYLTASRLDIMFAVCACSRFQTIVATSTTEAEYVAATHYCRQVLWIQNQLLDYGFNFINIKIYIDNESTICIVKNPVFHSKTKYIEIRHHFIRDAYEKKLIQVLKIYTDDNVADLLTKAFDVSKFKFLMSCDCYGDYLGFILFFGMKIKGYKCTGDQPPLTESSLDHYSSQDPRVDLEGTCGSRGDQVNLTHDSPLPGGHTSDRAKGSLNLEVLYALCTNLSNRVLALETINDAQAKEILTLKARIKKLKKRCNPSILHHQAWLRSVSLLSKKKNFSKKKSVSKQGRKNAKSGQ